MMYQKRKSQSLKIYFIEKSMQITKMHIYIINMLNWFSSTMKKMNNKMMSSRFKRLEKRRIKTLISKNKNLKNTFEEKEYNKDNVVVLKE